MTGRAPLLLVDDRQEDLLLLASLVADLPVAPHTVRSGEEALVLLDEQDFSVVVLDVRLGKMDGFETARRMRAKERPGRTPIVFLTALDFDEDSVTRAYDIGGVDFLFKPINPQIFRAKMEFFAELYLKTKRIERQAQDLKQVDAMKDQFLGILSHELRTPLNFITGAGSILEDEIAGPLNATQLKHVKLIMRGADALSDLVNDLLDMTQMRAGKFRIRIQEVDLREVISEVVEHLGPSASQKHIVLTAHVDDDLPPVAGDQRRLAQLLSNLVGNALKFTPSGGRILVRARREGDRVLCEIEDSGVGVPEHAHASVFEPFWQVDMSMTRKAGGTGLGLAISKALVEAHGGEIGLRSGGQAGSVFWFTVRPAV